MNKNKEIFHFWPHIKSLGTDSRSHVPSSTLCNIPAIAQYSTNKCNYPENAMSKYIPPDTILKLIWKYHECLCATKCRDYLWAAVTYITHYCAIRHSYIYHCTRCTYVLRSQSPTRMHEHGTNDSCHTWQSLHSRA